MNGLELAAVITAFGGFIGVVGALFANAKRIDSLADQLKEERHRAEKTRGDLILMGESLSLNRQDNAKLALLVNQLFNQFRDATGREPTIDMDMLHQMMTISYITGPLGPLDVEAVKRN